MAESDAATPCSALFEPDTNGRFVPTTAAGGAWTPGILHGGAVAALLTGLLEHEDQVMTRVLVELVGPAPSTPLRAELAPTEGGRRVTRQAVVLFDGDRPVARAAALRMRRADLELPEGATRHPTVFDPERAPDLSTPNRRAVAEVGRETFDSLAVALKFDRGAPEDRTRVWARLLLPVVAGRAASPVERVMALADLGSSGTAVRLAFRSWSFMNADLVVSFGRSPVGDWVGLDCESLLSPTGSGQSAATLHDADGPFARSSQSVLIEPR